MRVSDTFRGFGRVKVALMRDTLDILGGFQTLPKYPIPACAGGPTVISPSIPLPSLNTPIPNFRREFKSGVLENNVSRPCQFDGNRTRNLTLRNHNALPLNYARDRLQDCSAEYVRGISAYSDCYPDQNMWTHWQQSICLCH